MDGTIELLEKLYGWSLVLGVFLETVSWGCGHRRSFSGNRLFSGLMHHARYPDGKPGGVWGLYLV